MLQKLIQQREEILSKVIEAGIPKENIHSIHVFGSYFWGYANIDSDIDLYVILKEQREKVKDIEKISLHYQITPTQVTQKIKLGSWASYYVLKYASYRLFGEKLEVPKYPKHKFIDYLAKKRADINNFKIYPAKVQFIVVMVRIFYLNYLNNIGSFRLTDFQKCKLLSQAEVELLEKVYTNVFSRNNNSSEEIEELLSIANKIELHIIEYIKSIK